MEAEVGSKPINHSWLCHSDECAFIWRVKWGMVELEAVGLLITTFDPETDRSSPKPRMHDVILQPRSS
jgi:hypothetical protein